MTMKVAAMHWMDEKAPLLAENGLQEQVDWLVATVGPAKLLQELLGADLIRIRKARMETLRPGKDGTQQRVAKATVNKTLALFRRIVNHAQYNHNAYVRRFKWGDAMLPRRKGKPQPISEADEQIIFGILQDSYVQVSRFALTTGLRACECLMEWSQVNLRNQCITVYGKGHPDGREVPLGSAAMAILRTEYNQPDRHPTHVFTYVAKKNFTVPKTGQRLIKGERYPVTYSGWSSAWDRMREKSGLEMVNLHKLRHTLGSRMLAETGNLKLVKEQMGHASIKTTEEFYAGVENDALRDAQDAAAMRRVKT
jgi:integrase